MKHLPTYRKSKQLENPRVVKARLKENEKLVAVLLEAVAEHARENRRLRQDNDRVRSLEVTEPFIDEILFQMAKAVGRKIAEESPEISSYIGSAITFVCDNLKSDESGMQFHFMPSTLQFWLRHTWHKDPVVVFRLDPLSVTTNLPYGKMQEHRTPVNVSVMPNLPRPYERPMEKVECNVTTIRLP